MAIKPKSKAERMKSLKNLITNINKKEGYNAVNFASDPEINERLKVEFYPVKSLALRAAIQGLPNGTEYDRSIWSYKNVVNTLNIVAKTLIIFVIR